MDMTIQDMLDWRLKHINKDRVTLETLPLELIEKILTHAVSPIGQSIDLADYDIGATEARVREKLLEPFALSPGFVALATRLLERADLTYHLNLDTVLIEEEEQVEAASQRAPDCLVSISELEAICECDLLFPSTQTWIGAYRPNIKILHVHISEEPEEPQAWEVARHLDQERKISAVRYIILHLRRAFPLLEELTITLIRYCEHHRRYETREHTRQLILAYLKVMSEYDTPAIKRKSVACARVVDPYWPEMWGRSFYVPSVELDASRATTDAQLNNVVVEMMILPWCVVRL